MILGDYNGVLFQERIEMFLEHLGSAPYNNIACSYNKE